MFIPLRTDRPPRRRPYITEGLIVLNLLVYLAGLIGQASGQIDLEKFIAWGHFDPHDFKFRQLMTSMFMHDPHSLWHIAFNMLFLWVFGAPVEDRLGRASFLGFYLMGGAVAAIAHGMFSSAPVIGASGAIAAVTGAFLALFPRSHIIVLFLLNMTLIPVSALWFIGLYFVIDVLRQLGTFFGPDAARIAYMAHIAGYLYGFGTAFLLLALKIVKREEYDVFFLFTQARRRAAFRAASRHQAAGLWESASADTGARLKRKVQRSPTLSADQELISQRRAEINALATTDPPAAAAKYRELLGQAPDTVFAEQRQLELANQLCAEQDHAHAAAAYELLLERYPNTSKADEVRLMLAMMYARQLNRPALAREILTSIRPSLRDAGQITIADGLLAELKSG